MNIVYTDGACCKNGRPNATGGYGMYFKHSTFGNELCVSRKGFVMSTANNDPMYITNIRMEALAILSTIFAFTEKYIFNRVDAPLDQYMNQNFDNRYQEILHQPVGTNLFIRDCSGESFEIITDSLFWMNVIQSWMPKWIRTGILSKKKNPDILHILHYYSELMKANKLTMILTHVKSHQKGKRTEHADGNDVADVLATSAERYGSCEFRIVSKSGA